MTERYPDDATLLAIESDPTTGVEYIATGESPYYLAFRRTLQRLLLAAERANDLRVYAVDDLSVGVRAGRCVIDNTPIEFPETEPVSVASGGDTHLYLDAAGTLQTSGAGFPADRATFLPLASVTANDTTITAIEDRRGEAMLQAVGQTQLGLTATSEEINRALDGINLAVTAANLNTLNLGATSLADNLHTHATSVQNFAGEAAFTASNDSSDFAANVAIKLSLPSLLPADTLLRINRSTGFLEQSFAGTSFNLLGVHTAQHTVAGDLTADLTGVPLGVAPCDGTVAAVSLSLGDNLETNDTADNVSLDLRVRGVSALSTLARLRVSDGTGPRSTAQSEGVAAAIKTDGTESVQRGDPLTIDLTRTVNGTLTADARDATALVVFRAARPD